MTRTVTRPLSAEITAAFSVLLVSSSAMPRKPSPAQMHWLRFQIRPAGLLNPHHRLLETFVRRELSLWDEFNAGDAKCTLRKFQSSIAECSRRPPRPRFNENRERCLPGRTARSPRSSAFPKPPRTNPPPNVAQPRIEAGPRAWRVEFEQDAQAQLAQPARPNSERLALSSSPELLRTSFVSHS